MKEEVSFWFAEGIDQVFWHCFGLLLLSWVEFVVSTFICYLFSKFYHFVPFLYSLLISGCEEWWRFHDSLKYCYFSFWRSGSNTIYSSLYQTLIHIFLSQISFHSILFIDGVINHSSPLLPKIKNRIFIFVILWVTVTILCWKVLEELNYPFSNHFIFRYEFHFCQKTGTEIVMSRQHGRKRGALNGIDK